MLVPEITRHLLFCHRIEAVIIDHSESKWYRGHSLNTYHFEKDQNEEACNDISL